MLTELWNGLPYYIGGIVSGIFVGAHIFWRYILSKETRDRVMDGVELREAKRERDNDNGNQAKGS